MMVLVTERDMRDARLFIEAYLEPEDHDLLHDLAQAIADGRRPEPAPPSAREHRD